MRGRDHMKLKAIVIAGLATLALAAPAAAQGGYTTWRQVNRAGFVYQNEVRLYQQGRGSTYRVNRAYTAYQYQLNAHIGPGR